MLRVRVALSGWSGGPGLMSFYFQVPDPGSTSALRVAGLVRARMQADLSFIWPTGVSAIVDPEVADINHATGVISNVYTIAPPLPVSGTGTGGIAPPSVAVLLRYLTPTFVRGRRLKGRTFMSPLTSGMLAPDGGPTAQAVATVQSFGASLLTSATPGDTLVVWSRPIPAKVGPPATTAVTGFFGVVEGVSVSTKFAVLRSRRD